MQALKTRGNRDYSWQPWPLRIIDNTSEGADGVKFNDVNGDGLPDIATGWEEGGIVRAYLHPGPNANKEVVKEPWPFEHVGAAPDVEDAILIDLNNDQQFEVVASCEGKTQQVRLFHKTDQVWSHQDFPQLAGKNGCMRKPCKSMANMDLISSLALKTTGRKRMLNWAGYKPGRSIGCRPMAVAFPDQSWLDYVDLLP